MINFFRNSFEIYLAALMLIFFISSCMNKSRYPGPLSPGASIKTFRLDENFKAEIFAAEPLVIDPVCMQFDEEGNVYVVSMPDAYKPDAVKGKGRIVMLKDLNSDGRADTAMVFADSLKEATSILPWDGGLLIAAAPNIMYYKDTDGDGRADHKEILFTGFFTGNEEAQITNLRFGIDNWIYANNTGQAGEVTFTRKPKAPKLVMRGADFRFRLDRNQFELATGPGQFGLALDDWGHRFFTTNSIHISQVVIPLRYLARNPYLPSNLKAAVANISDHDPLMYQLSETPYWRQERTNRRNKDYQENHLDRVEYARDHFTAASGGTYYGGDAYPGEYHGNIFTGDASGNLVHRDVLLSSDSTPHYIAARAEAEKSKEFLAATDTWFRPVNFSVGPDGNLYVMDMYRQHIETPISIPDDLEADMDFNAGNIYGRIYRIVSQNNPAGKTAKPQPGSAKPEELVQLLAHKNQWWRMQAQRLLLQRHDKAVVPAVKELFNQSNDPRARLHALYVLEGLDALDADIVRSALEDVAAGVREHAAMLAERFPSCMKSVLQLIKDTSVRVALQATLSAGEFNDPSVATALADAVMLHGHSAWFRTAVLSSVPGSSVELLKALPTIAFYDTAADWKFTFCEALCKVIGTRNSRQQVEALLQYMAGADLADQWKAACVRGLAAGLQNAEGAGDAAKEKLKAIEGEAQSNASAALQSLKRLYEIK
ncbi:PVC-type heme-binding CxxCH protein [Agriterribacter sp.]|uniref:PVC-type heme-binding CxxCH protein n=1 Tax=Agriterribacter sp. TaxID=2821509 RepID=UPI002B89A494|nr:PVC-type heme-binding CxxCH protein [Agriterribacter sp.]HRP56004.1 dehydrogenase [Agriterribacter sp.]